MKISAFMAIAMGTALLPHIVNAAPAKAQERTMAPRGEEARVADARSAASRAEMMDAFDRAAMVAEDAFRSADPDANVPVIVVPDGEDAFRAVVLSDTPVPQAVVTRAVARYRVGAGRALSGGMVEDPAERTLSPVERRLASARAAALEEREIRGLPLCSERPPRTIILSTGADGTVPVYVMSARRDAGVLPTGGHYRFDIDGAGAVARWRVMAGGCRDARWDVDDPELDKQVFVLAHTLDDHPNAVLMLLSRRLPFSMGVVTGDVIWPVIGGEVTTPVPMMDDLLPAEE
ncbi:hypothetical protein [Croceicoccus hydrothermalis]|uniref:hypothetical protein n=1 Tax=Croceicoccus hydrothermalis TaxID=2867964 RepID=UPI001EFBF78D|nr:hypothetical protein [Croceicoccus hydrothermalis]